MFERDLELNMALALQDSGRFRINVFKQRGEVGMVIRAIRSVIPSIEELQLPQVLKEIIMAPRGLVLLVGSTGSGKSTTLASMIDHRNSTTSGHILTIEDPIEYLHKHKKSIVNQREVGIDTHAFHNALKNAMREAPDVILIGEILDATTMEAAIAFAETGHICLATLHSNNADQTIERILNFFPEGAHKNVLMNLALNLKAVVSQRLVVGVDGRRLPAAEVLINTPMIRDLLRRGQVHELKQAMEESLEAGMETLRPVPVPAVQGRQGRARGSAARGRLARRPGAEVPPVRRLQRRTRSLCGRVRNGSQPASAGDCRREIATLKPPRLRPLLRAGARRRRAARRAAVPAARRRTPAAPGTPASIRSERRVRRQVHREAARVVDLRDQAAVGDRRRVAVAEGAGRRMVLQQRFERGEAFGDPVPHPDVALGLRHAPVALEILQHAQVVERMDVAGDQLRQRAHALAVARGRRQQRRRSGHISSRYSRIASDCRNMRWPCCSTGTSCCGLVVAVTRPNAARRRRATGAPARCS